MAKLQRIESNSAVSQYRPTAGNISVFYAKLNGYTVQKAKLSDSTIVTLGVQADWQQSNSAAIDFIKNKHIEWDDLEGTAPAVSTFSNDAGYITSNSLVQADFAETDSSKHSFIQNKPTTIAGYGITDAKIEGDKVILGSNSIEQVQADWSEVVSSSKAFIKNKPGLVDTSNAGLMSATDKQKLDNLTLGYLGYFATPAELRAAHPTGQIGYYATVGSTNTIWAWDNSEQDWVDTHTNTVNPLWDNIIGKPTTIAGYLINDAKAVDNGDNTYYIQIGSAPSNSFTIDLSGYLTSVGWDDLTGTPPGVSTFSNDAGYITSNSLVQADWAETDATKHSFIQNKPTLKIEKAVSDSLTHVVTIGSNSVTVTQADYAETDVNSPAYIKNKPTIPLGQVQADYAESDSSEISFIKNKPETIAASGIKDVFINGHTVSIGGNTVTQVRADYAESDSSKYSFIENKPKTVAQLGLSDLKALQTLDEKFHIQIGANASNSFIIDLTSYLQYGDLVQADWSESDTTSKAFIQNKPTTVAQLGLTDLYISGSTVKIGSNSLTQKQVDWDLSDSTDIAFIKNKPTGLFSGNYVDVTSENISGNFVVIDGDDTCPVVVQIGTKLYDALNIVHDATAKQFKLYLDEYLSRANLAEFAEGTTWRVWMAGGMRGKSGVEYVVTTATSAAINATANTLYTRTIVAGDEYTFTSPSNGKAYGFRLYLTMPETLVSATLPSNILWKGTAPTLDQANTLYRFNFEWCPVRNKWIGSLVASPESLA